MMLDLFKSQRRNAFTDISLFNFEIHVFIFEERITEKLAIVEVKYHPFHPFLCIYTASQTKRWSLVFLFLHLA